MGSMLVNNDLLWELIEACKKDDFPCKECVFKNKCKELQEELGM